MMDKETKKRNKYNEDILKAVAIRHDVSVDYVRKSLKGTSKGIVPDELVKDYNKGEADLKQVVDQAIEKFKYNT
ncbi:hypothetical protein [Flavobacterium rivuli]|nr:hypothetical protein [Flavobacterium rivuli]